jgi:hypothetical protein
LGILCCRRLLSRCSASWEAFHHLFERLGSEFAGADPKDATRCVIHAELTLRNFPSAAFTDGHLQLLMIAAERVVSRGIAATLCLHERFLWQACKRPCIQEVALLLPCIMQLRGVRDESGLGCAQGTLYGAIANTPQLLAALVQGGLMRLLLDVPSPRLCASREAQVGGRRG